MYFLKILQVKIHVDYLNLLMSNYLLVFLNTLRLKILFHLISYSFLVINKQNYHNYNVLLKQILFYNLFYNFSKFLRILNKEKVQFIQNE